MWEENVADLADWGRGGSGAGLQEAGAGSPLQEVLWSSVSESLKNTVRTTSPKSEILVLSHLCFRKYVFHLIK